MKQHYIYVLIILFFCCFTRCSQPIKNNDYLLLFTDTTNDEYGYLNKSGDTIIPLGKYSSCFTDTFKTYAIVLKSDSGFVAINREEKILYKVFPFDNGPDYTSDGFFRIIENNKIGYADSTTGRVEIEPQFNCAFPFENGTAKVSNDCMTQLEGEHKIWLSDNWYYIDKTGKKLDRPVMNE